MFLLWLLLWPVGATDFCSKGNECYYIPGGEHSPRQIFHHALYAFLHNSFWYAWLQPL